MQRLPVLDSTSTVQNHGLQVFVDTSHTPEGRRTEKCMAWQLKRREPCPPIMSEQDERAILTWLSLSFS